MTRVHALLAVPALLIASLGLGLGACSPGAFLAVASGTPQATYARESIQKLADGQIDELVARLEPDLQNDQVRAEFERLEALLPKREPLQETLISFYSFFGSRPRTELVFEYAYPSTFVVTQIVLVGGEAEYSIAGFHVKLREESLKTIHAFRLVGKPWLHWVMLAAALAVLVVILVAFVACLRNRALERRWLWGLFICVGFFALRLNWTTGQLDVVPFSVALLGVALLASSPYSPWLLFVYVPVGAILYLVRHGKRRVANAVLESGHAEQVNTELGE